jgi:hypothetical protein
MMFEGTFQNGVVVPECNCALPDRTKVRCSTADPETERAEPSPTIWQRTRQFAEECEKVPVDPPSDYALNHDHYRHELPKRQ